MMYVYKRVPVKNVGSPCMYVLRIIYEVVCSIVVQEYVFHSDAFYPGQQTPTCLH